MQAFVSGQLGEKQKVRSLYKKLRRIGYEITHDWTTTDDLVDKRSAPEEAGRRAAADIEGVVRADLYILLSDNEKCGRGMYAELGAALAMHQSGKAIDIYIVGPMNHLSVFYLHPAIKHVRSVDELLDLQVRDKTMRRLIA